MSKQKYEIEGKIIDNVFVADIYKNGHYLQGFFSRDSAQEAFELARKRLIELEEDNGT